jgi:3-oxoadipate enol-lactonase
VSGFTNRGKALTGGVIRFPRMVWPGGSTLEEPRPQLPPGRVEYLPGVGDVFFRDTGQPPGRSAGTIVLLHGWMVPTDVHWFRTFEMLEALGWRVVAMDSRGHGRGLRAGQPFRLLDCANDTAALLNHLGCGPVVGVGYSMGGTILQLIARDHAEVLSGAVFCATASEFRTGMLMRMVWSGMGAFQLYLRLAPRISWEAFVRLAAGGDPATTEWLVGELRRGAAWDIAEAGREIGRFDSRPWVSRIEVPRAVLVTTRDLLVPATRQRDLARRLDASQVEIESDHLAPASTPRRFNRGLVEALSIVQGGQLDTLAAQAS